MVLSCPWCTSSYLQYFNFLFTFRGPCIVIYSYNKSQRDALLLKFILIKNSTCFRQICCQSPGVSTLFTHLDDWLTMHRSITLVDLQIDAENSYLFTYNIFIKILHMFQALSCSSSGGLCHNRIYAASVIITLCR